MEGHSMNNLETLLFMGTNSFAVAPLKALNESGLFKKIYVVTQPDKPKGRSYKLAFSEVKQYALASGLPVYQPETLKNGAFDSQLAEINPDITVVASYGKILPKSVLDYPKYGSINIHASLLPEYRGAAPVNRVIMDGKNITGVTVMKMAEGLDTGDMISSKAVSIGENETFDELYDRLSTLGAEMITEAIADIVSDRAVYTPQDDSLSSYAEKIAKQDEQIDWSLSAEEIHNKIRGLSSEPGAVTRLSTDGRSLKIYSSLVADTDSLHSDFGKIVIEGKRIKVYCGCGSLYLTSMKLEGQKRLSDKDFINGRKLSDGVTLN